LPQSVREKLFTQLKDKLPDDARETLEVYDRIQQRINRADATYQEIESIAVLFGDVPAGGQKDEVEQGSWCDTGKGYFLRVFPSGYTSTRVQVYVPKETGDPSLTQRMTWQRRPTLAASGWG